MKLIIGLIALALIIVSVILFQRTSAHSADIAALTARATTAEANLDSLNNLHRWVISELYPKYDLTHKRLWTGPTDPPTPPPPPPSFD